MKRSPYTLCLFLLGLRPGVRSRLAALSWSFNLLDNISASRASDLARGRLILPSTFPVTDLSPVIVGGVFEPGGVFKFGV